MPASAVRSVQFFAPSNSFNSHASICRLLIRSSTSALVIGALVDELRELAGRNGVYRYLSIPRYVNYSRSLPAY